MTKRNNYAGITYESTKAVDSRLKDVLCVALKPEIVDNCLEFRSAKQIEFDYKKGIECILKKTKEAKYLDGKEIAFYNTPLEVYGIICGGSCSKNANRASTTIATSPLANTSYFTIIFQQKKY